MSDSVDDLKYIFRNISNCNMCGAPSKSFKVIGKRQNKSQGTSPKKNIAITTTIIKCKNCGLIFSNPLPIPIEIGQHYNILPEEYFSNNYLLKNEEGSAGIKLFLQTYAGLCPNSKVLDVGSGMGFTIKKLLEFGCDAYGVEASVPFYNFSIEKNKVPKERIYQCAFENLNIKKEQFDIIIFQAVLEHVINPSESIKKTMDLLKPGGIVFIEVPSSKWLFSKIYNTYFKLIGTDYVTNLSPMHIPYHLYEFTYKSFKENGKLHNYSIKEIFYWVCNSNKKDFLNLFLNRIMSKTNTGMEIVVLLQKN